MLQIQTLSELETWLNGYRSEVSAVIALRSALRALPAVILEIRSENKPSKDVLDHTLRLFHVVAAARFMRYAPSPALSNAASYAGVVSARFFVQKLSKRHKKSIEGINFHRNSSMILDLDYANVGPELAAAFAIDSFDGGGTARTSAVRSVAASVAAYNDYNNTSLFTRNTINKTSGAKETKYFYLNTDKYIHLDSVQKEMWLAIAADAQYIAQGGTLAKLTENALWPSHPSWAIFAWTELSKSLHSIAPHWKVWVDWYSAILDGKPAWGLSRERSEAIMGDAVLWPKGNWNSGPDHINPRIQALIDREQQPILPFGASWDFFVSYSHQDEIAAREIVSILEMAGHSTFAQFNDFAPGANFVTEMQRGLAGSGRVVALYSPAYVASAHCQAEWNAAYNSDADGSKRKLVPFLIAPTELPPLARQIVFKNLFGLSASDRKKAVLEAIAPPAVRSLDQIRIEAASIASPQPKMNADGRVGLKPNAVVDTPRTTRDLAHLPVIMCEMINNIMKALPDNTPPVVRHGFAAYGGHLLERGTKLEPQYLNRVCDGIEREYESTGSEYWGKGLEVWIVGFFNDHQIIKTHFPLKDEEVFAKTPINEAEAMGEAITKPAEMANAAAQAMVGANLADESVGKLFNSVAAQGRDYAHFPPDENAGKPGSTRVSVKRRYVVGALGLFVAFYNFVGSTASIYSTEVGAKFLKALGDAIEMLSKLLLR